MLKSFFQNSCKYANLLKPQYSLPKSSFNYAGLNCFSSVMGTNMKPREIFKNLDVDSIKSTHVKVATCNLNQWALDFAGNKRRIIESIKICKEKGVGYRVGPELEITGYGCEDHFLELDTIKHSWEVIAEIVQQGLTDGIIVDLGAPVIYRDVLYNARIIILNRTVLMIRPKTILADDGNYREGRYFTAWKKDKFEEFNLPNVIKKLTGQHTCPIGVGILKLRDCEIGHEICEELWSPTSPHIMMGLDGAEIIFNSSGSHFELGRIRSRIDLLRDATSKSGGCYVYSNQIGCDGSRMYFDGCSMIGLNGKFLAIASQFMLREVEVHTAVVDLDTIREAKLGVKSRCVEAAGNLKSFPRVEVDFSIGNCKEKSSKAINEEDYVKLKDSEVGWGSGCYLWDYMRKSGACGYFLPFSGGADSAATALVVHHMCQIIYDTINEKRSGYEFVLSELRRILKEEHYEPISTRELVGKMLYTCYMKADTSVEQDRVRARKIADEIGSTHIEIDLRDIASNFVQETANHFDIDIKKGKDKKLDTALRNLNGRTRMIMSYYIAQMIPIKYNLSSYVLVLSSGNIGEALRGHFAKYDNSSGDINPIGGFSKTDLRRYIRWCHETKGIQSVKELMLSKSEQERLNQHVGVVSDEMIKNDEKLMGLTFEELSRFGRLRKIYKLGPVAMFKRLLHEWDHLTPKQVGDKIKFFFQSYSKNRHKQVTVTPSIHGEKYSCDDNRYDPRPLIYNNEWTYQFRRIDEIIDGFGNENPSHQFK